MKRIHILSLAASLIVATTAVCEAQDGDKSVEKTGRRMVRVEQSDAGAGETQKRRIVRVFSGSPNGGPDHGSELVFVGEDGPGAYGYSYGFPRQSGYLGVQLVELTPELREHFGAPAEAGVMVSVVAEDSPASEAGLRVGDILTAVDGETMSSGFEVARRIGGYEDGTDVALEIWRQRRLQTLSANITVRRRTAVDIGPFVLPGVGRMAEGIKIDLGNLSEHVIEIDQEGINEALEKFRSKFQETEVFERFQMLGQSRMDLQQRLEELEERLRELEQQLDALPED